MLLSLSTKGIHLMALFSLFDGINFNYLVKVVSDFCITKILFSLNNLLDNIVFLTALNLVKGLSFY
jgi:hypothetical protein